MGRETGQYPGGGNTTARIWIGDKMSFEKAVQKQLLASVNSFGDGSVHDLEGVYRTFDITATWSGTIPDDLSLKIKGSLDGTSYDNIADRRMVASPFVFSIAGRGARYVKGNYSAKTGGGVDTELSVNVVAGGNR